MRAEPPCRAIWQPSWCTASGPPVFASGQKIRTSPNTFCIGGPLIGSRNT